MSSVKSFLTKIVTFIAILISLNRFQTHASPVPVPVLLGLKEDAVAVMTAARRTPYSTPIPRSPLLLVEAEQQAQVAAPRSAAVLLVSDTNADEDADLVSPAQVARRSAAVLLVSDVKEDSDEDVDAAVPAPTPTFKLPQPRAEENAAAYITGGFDWKKKRTLLVLEDSDEDVDAAVPAPTPTFKLPQPRVLLESEENAAADIAGGFDWKKKRTLLGSLAGSDLSPGLREGTNAYAAAA